MPEGIDGSALVSIIGAVVSIVGAVVMVYVNIRRLPVDLRKGESETSKTNSESFAAIAEASESIATGARVSNEFLRQQIDEMKQENKRIKERQEDTDALVEGLKIKQEEQRVELLAWQDWAKRLSHQVISLGGKPVAFKPVPIDRLTGD